MRFTKMHGCGNDYVYVNCLKENVPDPEKVAKLVSDRHFGIGSDGLILIQASDVADFRMSMYNADGSEGKMCGNGVRCIAKYVYDNRMTDKKTITLETKGGIKTLNLTVGEDNLVSQVEVDMGKPILKPEDIPVAIPGDLVISEPIEVNGKSYDITCVSMGNPHAVVFVKDTEAIDIEKLGPCFEHHPVFPDRVNTEFVQIMNEHTIKMRVWERGAGETLACGTGACASVVASFLNGFTEDTVLVHLRGGDLKIHYDHDNEKVMMTGPAATVFSGEILLDE
ncbi:MAG: diaminopimelate epimerase [Clostridiales bacterium]|nr:diaminopimelate epimerase [Clostridiales bacterium]